MSLRKRKVLALVVVFATFVCLQCADKEGPVSPIMETEPPQYTITVSANPSRVEPGTQSDIVAAVEDLEGEPVENYELGFSTDFGTIEPSATTNGDGTAVVKYTAPATTGYATITVSGDDALPKAAHVQVGEGAVEVDPFSILADGISTATVSLKLTAAEGEPVVGVIVEFSVDYGFIYPTSVETGSDGVATTTLVSAASIHDIYAIVAAEATIEGSTITEGAIVLMRGVTISADASPDEIPADGISSSRVVVWLRETTSGSPVSGAEVMFGTTLGAIGGSTNTDSEGFGSVYLLAGTVPGVAEVSAVYGGLAAFTYVTLGDLNLSLTAPSPKMVADGVSTQSVVATLLTEDNNPVKNVTIDFSTTDGIIVGSARTDVSGQARAQLTSAAYTATAEVSASFTSSTATVDVDFEDPDMELKASPMTLTALPSNWSQITAYVSFSDGSPVPDSTHVAFSTSEGSITSPRLTRSGIATADLQPSGVASTEVTVEARAGNSAATTNVIFTPDEPTVVFVKAMPETIAGDGSSYATIVAEVTDDFGNHVADGTVINFVVTSGNGIVTPGALTTAGVATAQFVPTGGGGLAVVSAGCRDYCSAAGNVAIVILSESAGAIVADPDTAWIAVAGTWDNSQATVVARVYDSNRNPVGDGTDVTFLIEDGPGGGEYIDTPGSGYGPVVKETSGGAASITVNSGSRPGTVLMSISSPGAPSAGCKIGITAGDPDSILISLGEVAINGDGTYTLAVSAIVRDAYNNPVENGTVVYFTLDRSDIGFINPETYTGNIYPCVELEGEAIKGLTRACLTYPTESIFEFVTIIANTGGGAGGDEIKAELGNGLPIVDGSIILEAFPASVSGAAGGTVTIYVTVWDHYGLIPVDKAGIGFGVEGAGIISPPTAITDETGVAMTTLIIPPGTDEGVTKVNARVWMSDIVGDIEILITP